MAFDKPTRSRLASFVGKARDLIADEFTWQFQSLYGISDKGTITPLEQLGHLDDIGLATAALLRERIDYLVKTHPDDREGLKAAVARLAREQAFTVLNRLAAICMAEKRGIIVESVSKAYQSKGFKVFEQVAGSRLGDTYHRYRRYIFCLFDELAVDLGVLFDRRSPQGLLFPRETALQALFDLLNAQDLDPLWAEDETIGWIYQYYNDPAERKKMRDESAAPRNSRELAVRNQFFTPRYVVEFLTDNTLGRIWYEMTQGKTRLTAQCRYLVRWPTEIFLKPNETAPETLPQEDLSQEELLKQPVHIPHRPLKDPREIGLLDPACGSMHFGLYAFDLFEAIYEEAWDLGLESLRLDYPEKEVFLREVPRLIIENNIHGIDIDPRATQIAGLSLWLRAQKSWQEKHITAAQRPRIMRSNIVCAEPMPGNPEMLREFTATLHPPLLGQLVEKVFAQMQLAGEAGSLLKIEEEIATLVKDAKKLWQTRPKAEQMELSLGLKTTPKTKQEELPLDVSGISDERFWETAEERIYAALHAYAQQAESGGYQRRLFADDAARGFAFIDLCRKRYDLVVMNPPFGELAIASKDYVFQEYVDFKYDIYASFVIRGLQLLSKFGRLGAITSRTGFFLTSLKPWRLRFITDSGLTSYVDLGLGVLDSAMVEACCFVLQGDTTPTQAAFINSIPAEDKGNFIRTSIAGQNLTWTHPSSFSSIPNTPFAYWAPPELRSLFASRGTLFQSGFRVRQGLGSSDNFRFLRLWWEVPSLSIGFKKYWASYAKGGGYLPFWGDQDLLVAWSDDGREIKQFSSQLYGSWSKQITNVEFYSRPGLTYSSRTSSEFSPRTLPAASAFDTKGSCIFDTEGPDDRKRLTKLLVILQSATFRSLLNMCVATSGETARSYTEALVEKMPIPNLDTITEVSADDVAALILSNIQSERNIENTHSFLLPKLSNQSLGELLTKIADNVAVAKVKYDSELNKVGLSVALAYGLSPNIYDQVVKKTTPEHYFPLSTELPDSGVELAATVAQWIIGTIFGRWDICFATGEHQAPELPDPFAPLPVCPPGMLQNAEGLPAGPKDVPADYPLHISWPGILVDDENHPEDIVSRVRESLEVIWKDRADAIEQEACELIGVKTLRDYFRRPSGFFADHLKRYSKSRRQAPIYWPLSTAKGSYTLWIYYHRLTDQTLHTALADFIDPKLKTVRAEISALRESLTPGTRLEELLDTEKQLADFYIEIEDIIKLPWKPNLNDGVLITACPLWKLFHLPKWQKDLKACWDKLEKGEYDWAHLAYSIWPKRVEEVCKKDRSIAIAHGLEAICKTENPKPKKTRNRRQSNGGA